MAREKRRGTSIARTLHLGRKALIIRHVQLPLERRVVLRLLAALGGVVVALGLVPDPARTVAQQAPHLAHVGLLNYAGPSDVRASVHFASAGRYELPKLIGERSVKC